MSDRGYATPKHHTKSDFKFKTPLPYTPKCDQDVFYTPRKEFSDSEESTHSENAGSACASSENGEINIVAEFDDLMRTLRQRKRGIKEAEACLLTLGEQMTEVCREWKNAVDECHRLQVALNDKTKECSDLAHQLCQARLLLDQEKKRKQKVIDERDQLEIQLETIRDVLFRDPRNRLADETKEKLAFLNNGSGTGFGTDFNGIVAAPQLSAIAEGNTTGSLLSDLSCYSQSGDDLNSSKSLTGWKKHRRSTIDHPIEPPQKKRRSSEHRVVEINQTDTVRATTTLTVEKHGPITATSVIESVPKDFCVKSPGRDLDVDYHPTAPPAHKVFEKRQDGYGKDNKTSFRQHTFQSRSALVIPVPCAVCGKSVGFAKPGAKCTVCRANCHNDCKKYLPLPCIPAVNTPTMRKGVLGVIGDYTPTIPPMVPALIIHCVNEIELRGLNEIGLYRISGSEKDVKNLKEKFLKRRGSPCLNQIDIHVLCSTVKDFLRTLQEPLITHSLWPEFVHAVEASDEQDIAPALYQVISELPQPNRDTLAYMILHLKKVAESKDCKMPIENLARVFGPTIVGYSSEALDVQSMFSEITQQAKVMEHLMKLPTDYWSNFVNVEEFATPTSKLQQTPSTDSLLRPAPRRGFYTPSNGSTIRKPHRFFPTPPHRK